MNQRDDVFGYLLPLEWGTNVIVVVADGGGGNLGSKMFVVVRSDRFQASWESPAFGTFANGQTTDVAVAVSPVLDEGLETPINCPQRRSGIGVTLPKLEVSKSGLNA